MFVENQEKLFDYRGQRIRLKARIRYIGDERKRFLLEDITDFKTGEAMCREKWANFSKNFSKKAGIAGLTIAFNTRIFVENGSETVISYPTQCKILDDLEEIPA